MCTKLVFWNIYDNHIWKFGSFFSPIFAFWFFLQSLHITYFLLFSSWRVIQNCDKLMNSYVFIIQTSLLPIHLLPYNLGMFCSSWNNWRKIHVCNSTVSKLYEMQCKEPICKFEGSNSTSRFHINLSVSCLGKFTTPFRPRKKIWMELEWTKMSPRFF